MQIADGELSVRVESLRLNRAFAPTREQTRAMDQKSPRVPQTQTQTHAQPQSARQQHVSITNSVPVALSSDRPQEQQQQTQAKRTSTPQAQLAASPRDREKDRERVRSPVHAIAPPLAPAIAVSADESTPSHNTQPVLTVSLAEPQRSPSLLPGVIQETQTPVIVDERQLSPPAHAHDSKRHHLPPVVASGLRSSLGVAVHVHAGVALPVPRAAAAGVVYGQGPSDQPSIAGSDVSHILVVRNDSFSSKSDRTHVPIDYLPQIPS